MRFGIIGTGMIAQFHAKAIQALDDCTLVGVCGSNQLKAQAFGENYGCEGYGSIEDLCSSDVDIVTIATPSGMHLKHCRTVASHGKHIICEKPLEITPQRVEQMIEICSSHGVVLSGIFNRRFNLAVTYLKQAIDDGRFGKLSLCDAYVKWYRTQAYYDSGGWRGTTEIDGGGALMNQGIHTIDLLQYLAGPIKRLSGSVACVSHERIDVEDTAVAILEYASGARGVIEGSTSSWSKNGHAAEIQISGSQGSVFLKDDKFSTWEFEHETALDEQIRTELGYAQGTGLGANDPGAINYDGHIANFKDAVKAIRDNRTPAVSGQEGLKSVKIIDAIYRSAEQNGAWINL